MLLNATTRHDGKAVSQAWWVLVKTSLRNQVLAASKRVADDLTRLIDTANAPIFGIDTHGKNTEGNAKASSLLGYNKDEEMGNHLMQRFITESSRLLWIGC